MYDKNMNGLIFIQNYKDSEIFKTRNGRYVLKTKNRTSKQYETIAQIVESYAKKKERKIATKK